MSFCRVPYLNLPLGSCAFSQLMRSDLCSMVTSWRFPEYAAPCIWWSRYRRVWSRLGRQVLGRSCRRRCNCASTFAGDSEPDARQRMNTSTCGVRGYCTLGPIMYV
jgi:hypothetical protein